MKTRRFVIRKSVQQNSSLTLRYVSKKSILDKLQPDTSHITRN